MTAALAGLLRRLGGHALERAPGLLPALIAGVGVRLDSPLPTVRRGLLPPADLPALRRSAGVRLGSPPSGRHTRLNELCSRFLWPKRRAVCISPAPVHVSMRCNNVLCPGKYAGDCQEARQTHSTEQISALASPSSPCLILDPCPAAGGRAPSRGAQAAGHARRRLLLARAQPRGRAAVRRRGRRGAAARGGLARPGPSPRPRPHQPRREAARRRRPGGPGRRRERGRRAGGARGRAHGPRRAGGGRLGGRRRLGGPGHGTPQASNGCTLRLGPCSCPSAQPCRTRRRPARASRATHRPPGAAAAAAAGRRGAGGRAVGAAARLEWCRNCSSNARLHSASCCSSVCLRAHSACSRRSMSRRLSPPLCPAASASLSCSARLPRARPAARATPATTCRPGARPRLEYSRAAVLSVCPRPALA